jgi:hypothetical protein
MECVTDSSTVAKSRSWQHPAAGYYIWVFVTNKGKQKRTELEFESVYRYDTCCKLQPQAYHLSVRTKSESLKIAQRTESQTQL